MSNRLLELFVIIFILIISFAIAFFSCLSVNIDPSKHSQDFAQILAEIVAIIFVLPQVIIQLTLRPQRKNIRTVFAGLIPFYLLYYVAAIFFLASNYFDIFFSNELTKILVLFLFISSLLLIIPYLFFLIKEYSTSENIFYIKKNKILKKIKKLMKLNVTQVNNNKSSNKIIKLIEKDVLDLVIELKDYILIYGQEDYNFFSNGINALAELIEKPYSYNVPNIDNLLLEILDIITEVGLKTKVDVCKNRINERLFSTAKVILQSRQPENRINLFVTKIISIIEKIISEGTVLGSRETLKKAITIIHQISLYGLRAKPPIILEYHLFAETFKRMCIFSIEHSYDNCTRDVLEDLGYMVELSVKSLPINNLPVYKICDVLTEIGILASKKRNEVFCIQCVNRIISIIADLKKQKISIEINNCMASLLELVANIWINFEELDIWLHSRLDRVRKDNKIDFKKYINPTENILASKSLISKAIFSDFVDSLNDKHKN